MVRILACLSFLPVAAQVGGPYVPPPGSVVSTKVRLPRNIASAAGLWSAGIITLRLNADGTGSIIRGKDDPLIDTGRWAQTGAEVLFEFDSKPGRAALPSLRWTMRAGTLVPLENNAYGSLGLPFKRQSATEESHAEGVYKASDEGGREFRLELKHGGAAIFTARNVKGKTAAEKARWSAIGEEINLQFNKKPGRPPVAPLTWLLEDNTLAPKRWDRTVWGPLGLAFTKTP